MTQNTKLPAADAGATEPNHVYPSGPGTAVFTMSAGAGNLEVCCDKVEDIKSGAGEPLWAVVAAVVVSTPQVYNFTTKVSAIRLANVGAAGVLQVTWKS